jgi:putative acetyltransferase
VAALVASAFRDRPYASGWEYRIPAALHEAGVATAALVAELEGRIVGQAVFSPVTLDGAASNWHALGPVAVTPERQREGIGGRLIVDGLARLHLLGSGGCVVLGDGGYYRRFGFRPPRGLSAIGLPPEFFFVLPFGPEPEGAVIFHSAFDA